MRRYLATLLLLTLAACGYKGPLYLPKPTTATAAKPQTSATPMPTPTSTPSPTPAPETNKQ